MEWKYSCHVQTVGISNNMINTLLSAPKDLERLVLISRCSEPTSARKKSAHVCIGYNSSELEMFFQSLEAFITKMKKCVCCCLVDPGTFSNPLKSSDVELFTRRFLQSRPSLWLYMSGKKPLVRNAPSIHFQGIIEPLNCIPLPTFSKN